ncbi:MAG: thrombospondin type 3 repeat-containing protein [Candidatus Pacebacteria bacterium]|nr:thrombospondin type 3 repeat-containing protein [Candidatus Paceibacterota bacterium]
MIKNISKKIIILLLVLSPLISLAENATLTTLPASFIGTNSARLDAKVEIKNINIHGVDIGAGESPITNVKTKFRYSTSVNTSCKSMTNYAEINAVIYTNSPFYHLYYFGQNLSGLQTGTRYYFCGVSSYDYKHNNNTVYGKVLSFKTKGAPPTPPVLVMPNGDQATKIGKVITESYSIPIDSETGFQKDGEATMYGSVSGNDGVGYAYFRYSEMGTPPIYCNDIFGSNMRSMAINNPNSGWLVNGNFSADVRNLASDTKYYYCAVVSNHPYNPTSIEYGEVKDFITPPCVTCPHTSIKTNAALIRGSSSVDLQGEYSSKKEVATYFEYKTTEFATDWNKTEEQSHGSNTYGKIKTFLKGLRPDTHYIYHAVARTSDPTQVFLGNDVMFKTSKASGLGDQFGWIFDGTVTTTEDEDATGGPDEDCPYGTTGTPPNCTPIPPPPLPCGEGYTGTPPNCVPIPPPLTCGDGYTGTPPNCVAIPDENLLPSVTVWATPPSIESGSTSVIHWESENTTSCDIQSSGSGTSGSFTTPPLTSDHSYTITCTGPLGSASDTATVFVGTGGISVTVHANPATVLTGGTSIIDWSSTGATSCNSGGHGTGTSGSFTTLPLTLSTSFTVSCTGPDGSASDTADVFVDDGGGGDDNLFPTVTVTAKPSTVLVNGTSTISWTSENANSCNAGAGNGTGTSGSFVTIPLTNSRSFTVTCTGLHGTGSDTTDVFVDDGSGNDDETPIVTMTANPASIQKGGNSTITWSSVNAVSCNSGGHGTGTSGSFNTGALNNSHSYTVTCTNPAGIGSDNVDVFVDTDDEGNNQDDIDDDGINNVLDDDTDGDGIPNNSDNDDDGDGVSDANDSSPTGSGNFTDYDGDGIKNENDGDIDGDGIPNSQDDDTDGDGIPNNSDNDDDNDGLEDSADSTPKGSNNPIKIKKTNNNNGNNVDTNNGNPSVLGEITVPPNDAIVRYHEGVETVFIRQIMRNTTLQQKYGHKEGADLQAFANYLAHFFGKNYGYVAKNRKEVRVRYADVAAYELREIGGSTIVYESYQNKTTGNFEITGIRKLNSIFKLIFKYEYYFLKKR